MIRLSGLVDLKALKEQDEPEKEEIPQAPEANGDKNLTLKKLLKLKTMDLSPEQEKKVDEMLSTLHETMDEEFKAKDIPAGTSWKLAGTGWAAKNRQGKTNYWYGKDANKNKEAADKWSMNEGEEPGQDHEVSMAGGHLDDIIKNATELKEKLGQDEKDVPAWIQDHISQAQNFINQANTNFHEQEKPEDKAEEPAQEPQELDEEETYGSFLARNPHLKNRLRPSDFRAMQKDDRKKQKTGTWTTQSGKKATRNSDGTIKYTQNEEAINEEAPSGWEKTVLAMKKHKEIDNPWALAHWMKKKGYHQSEK